MQDDQIKKDPVIQTLTRPATLFGVPLGPLKLALIPILIAFVATANPLVLLLAAVVCLILDRTVGDDPYRLSVACHWLATRAKYPPKAGWF
jgi:type IV secretory pathway VirB3-like protein